MAKVRRRMNLWVVGLVSLILVAVGLCFIFYKTQSVKIFTIGTGVSLIISAIYSVMLVGDIRIPTPGITTFKTIAIVRSCLQVMFGTFMILYPIAFMTGFYSACIWIASIYLIVNGIVLLSEAIAYHPKGFMFPMILEAAAMIFFGVIIMIYPQIATTVILDIFGFVLIALGIAFFISSFSRRYDLPEVSDR